MRQVREQGMRWIDIGQRNGNKMNMRVEMGRGNVVSSEFSKSYEVGIQNAWHPDIVNELTWLSSIYVMLVLIPSLHPFRSFVLLPPYLPDFIRISLLTVLSDGKKGYESRAKFLLDFKHMSSGQLHFESHLPAVSSPEPGYNSTTFRKEKPGCLVGSLGGWKLW